MAQYRSAREQLNELQQRFDAAWLAIAALHLLPGEPEVRAWALEARPLIDELRARPVLERLDGLLAETASSARRSDAASASVEVASE